MRLTGNSKGYARQTMQVLCQTCGTNHELAYDKNSDQFICYTCIEVEQNVIDDKTANDNDEMDGINDWNDNHGQELDRRNK
jgi:hypothetical protein